MRKIIAAALSLGLLNSPAAAQEVVIDPWQLARQVQLAADQAKELARYSRSLIATGRQSVEDMQALVKAAKALKFEQDALEHALAATFPEVYAAGVEIDQLLADAALSDRMLHGANIEGLKTIGAAIETLTADVAALEGLTEQNLGAIGGLQAAQTGNELLALGIQHDIKTSLILAQEAKAAALERARAHAERERSKVRRERFLSGGDAYPGSK